LPDIKRFHRQSIRAACEHAHGGEKWERA
jgi:hypothetical protein